MLKSYQLRIHCFYFNVYILIFLAYVMQVKYEPYLCQRDFQRVLQEHSDRVKHQQAAENGTAIALPHKNAPMHALVDNDISRRLKFRNRSKIQLTRMTSNNVKNDKKTMGSRMLAATDIITDYNVIESVLLCCSVLIALSGIVFENVLPDSPYESERKALTYMAIGVVSFSMLYILLVMSFEINR